MAIKTNTDQTETEFANKSIHCKNSEIPPIANFKANDSQKPSIARNVLTNWIGHFAFIIGGFILPRMINDHLGQEQLGVWDFGWSTVVYLNLLTAGIASAVNRYVAKYRASSQWNDMNEAVSCCAGIFTGSAICGVAITITLIYLMPWISPTAFLPYLKEIQILLLCLGLSVSIDLFLPTYVGIISGYQRYDLLATIETCCYLLLLGTVVLILVIGGDLYVLGIPILGMRIVEGLLKRAIANRLCPNLKISPFLITQNGIRTVISFGGKTLLETVAKMALYQGNSMLIAYLLGPAALAIYTRSMSLVLHANKLLFQFGRVFAPSASHLKSIGDDSSLRSLLLNSTQSGTLIALPLTLFLGLRGGDLLQIWMGPGYADLAILPILATGHFFSQSQVGSFYVLMGTNQHGRASLAILLSSIMSLAATLIMVKHFGLGLLGAGLSVSLAVALPYLTIVPHIAAQSFGINLSKYFTATMLKPILLCLPTALCLLATREVEGLNYYQSLGLGLSLGGFFLIFMYWNWALPRDMKSGIKRRLSKRHF